MNSDFKKIALCCKQFRQSLGLTQTVVANELGVTVSNVSAFERGVNNNAMIYNWYIRNGLLDYFKYLAERRSV